MSFFNIEELNLKLEDSISLMREIVLELKEIKEILKKDSDEN